MSPSFSGCRGKGMRSAQQRLCPARLTPSGPQARGGTALAVTGGHCSAEDRLLAVWGLPGPLPSLAGGGGGRRGDVGSPPS